MAMPYIDTPRTEFGDHTRLSAGDLDNFTENSIPSPSKEGNDLLKQIKAMRGPSLQTPRSRAPFGNRRNVQKNEFTPLLKSAATNRFMRSAMYNQENTTPLKTPAGLKAGYGMDSPALPLNSSIIREEYTGSPVGPDDGSRTPQVPAPSSSAMSTPVALMARAGDGPLENRGNLATLREQEAKLEQIDKENFGLKLKIHFLEEQMKKTGKDFNATALKENTELKVDKITLQTELKKNRKALDKAQVELEEYKRQFAEYTEKVKRRHLDEAAREELDKLKQEANKKDAKIKALEKSLESNKTSDEQVAKLQDDIGDLEAELRAKDRELDDKDDELERLRKSGASAQEKQREQEDREQELSSLQDELRQAKEELKAATSNHSTRTQAYNNELEEKTKETEDLQSQLFKSENDTNAARRQLEDLEANLNGELRKQNRTIEELNGEVHRLRTNLETAEGRDVESEKLHDEIAELKAELREKEQSVKDTEDELIEIETRLEEERTKADRAMQHAQQRISELEQQQSKGLKELQALREYGSQASNDRHKALEDANSRIHELEDELEDKEVHEQQLKINLKEVQNQVKELTARLEQEQTEHDQHEQNMQDKINQLEDEVQSSTNKLKAQEKQSGIQSQLQDEADVLRRTLKETESKLKKLNDENDYTRQNWNDERRSLEQQKSRAEEQATDLQRAIDTLRETEGSLSTRESKLQQALDSEKLRRQDEEFHLQQEIDEVKLESNQRLQEVSHLKARLSTAQQELEDSQDEVAILQEKIQALEDEVEVLQSSMDDDIDHLQQELAAAKEQKVGLQKQFKDFKTEVEATKTTSRGTPSPTSTPAPQRELKQEVSSLREQLSSLKKERQDLQRQLEKAQTAQLDALNDFDTLQLDMRASTGTKGQLQQKMQDVRNQLVDAKAEKQRLELALSDANLNLDTLQVTVTALEDNKESLQQQLREVRMQLQNVQRDLERKHQAQIATYEDDIQNLEQDLADAKSNQDVLAKANASSEQQVTRLKTKVKNLEAQLDSTRNKTFDHDTSADERRDLHEMLKDAKLEAEDLALQIRERDARITSASIKESDLRAQLKRVREERAVQASRADATTKELSALQRAHDHITEQLAQLQALQRTVRFSKSTNNSSVSAKQHDSATSDAQSKRHAAELRGLVKQIEYLSARCRREETFRRDLGYMKQYFTKQVEMYGKCTQADLRLVRAMGIPVDDVVAQQEEEAALDGSKGRVVRRDGGGTRPTLRTVGLMIVAGLRMKGRAEKWDGYRKEHEGLLKKLKGMKRGIGRGVVA